MKSLLSLSVLFSALTLVGAPVVPDTAVEGFPTYEGISPANFVYGRTIVPSDLRQRAVLIVQYDANKLQSQLLQTVPLQSIDGFPAGEFQWDTADYPRTGITVVSILGEELDPKTFGEAFKSKSADEEKQQTENRQLGYWRSLGKAYYNNVKPAGEPDNLAETPYVYVIDGRTKEPLYKGKFDKKEITKIKNAMTKAMLANKEWTPVTGVAEVQHNKKAMKIIAAGKSLDPCFQILKAGFKNKDPDVAKESQIMFDALHQYRGDLVNRIQMEAGQAPARAYMDAMTLFNSFPREKKALQPVTARLTSTKEIKTIGECMAKFIEWNDPDYVCKNASEAKKNVVKLKAWKQALEKLQTHPNARISGEAALIGTQLDALIEAMPTKVPQK